MIFSIPVLALKSDEPPLAVSSIVSVPVPPIIDRPAKKSSALPFTVRFTLAELVTESSATPLSSPRIPSPLFLPVKITVVSAVQVLPTPPRTRAISPVSSSRLKVVAPPIAPSAVREELAPATNIGEITSILLTFERTEGLEIAVVVVNVSTPSPPSIVSVFAILAAVTKISLPAPPEIFSTPVPSVIVSLPAPASITLVPAVPAIISLPAPAVKLSAFVPRFTVSLPSPVVIIIGVAELVPVIVTGSRAVNVLALIVRLPPVAPSA